jgi:P27 family predicted phage terminase small subunit
MATRPKPTRLRILEGNRSKTPLPKNEPMPPVVAPACPAWVRGEAKREWTRMVAALLPLGMVTAIDGSALAHYCDLHAKAVGIAKEMARPQFRYLIEECDTMIDAAGAGAQVVKARPNPLVRMSLQLKQQLRLYLIEFGLTPSSRSRVKSAIPAERSKLERFLHGA